MNNLTQELSILQYNMGDLLVNGRPNPRPNITSRASIFNYILEVIKPNIVTLQETNSQLVSHFNLTHYYKVDGGNGLMVLLHKHAFIETENKLFSKRAQFVRFALLNNTNKQLNLLNVHFPVLYLTEGARRDIIRSLIGELDKWLARKNYTFDIISGDFNLPPYDEIIVGNSGFVANRDIKYALKQKGTIGQGLYNISWCIFGGNCGALGTLYTNTGFPNGPWHIPDQIFLNPHLLKDASTSINILTSIDGNSLTKPKVNHPNKEVCSDHFPVNVIIKNPCLL